MDLNGESKSAEKQWDLSFIKISEITGQELCLTKLNTVFVAKQLSEKNNLCNIRIYQSLCQI